MWASTSVIVALLATSYVALVTPSTGSLGASASRTTVVEDGSSETVVWAGSEPSGPITSTRSGTGVSHDGGIRATSGSPLAAVRPLPSSGQAAVPSTIVTPGSEEVSVPVTPGTSVRP